MNPRPNEPVDGQSIGALIDLRAQTVPDQIFLVDPHSGQTTNYLQLKNEAAAITEQIASLGVNPGEAVAFALGNSTRSAISILSIMYGGYLATAINLVAGNDTIAYVLEHSGARVVIADEKGRQVVSQAATANSAAIITADAQFSAADQSAVSPAREASTDGLLMYTSGTTGRPKGVVLTHANLIAGGKNAARAHQLTAGDRAMCVLPLYHINGLCVTIMGPLLSGGSVVIPLRFSVASFWNTIKETGCTWFSVVPTQISYLLHDSQDNDPARGELNGLRFGRSASAPLSPDVQEAFEARFGVSIIETMGLTETAAQILSNPLPPGVRKIGSPGIAFGNEIRIGDELQNEMPSGVEGEVLVRGPNVMRQYLKNEEATRQAITPDGWLRTGDLGKMDDDGYVFITGRLKELIIKGGENIAPREIDEALYRHPDVVEAAAFACECRDFGQRVEAAVMLSTGSKVSEADLLKLCETKLGAFKTPDRIHFLPELPKGPSGKIQRIKLAEFWAEDKMLRHFRQTKPLLWLPPVMQEVFLFEHIIECSLLSGL